MEINYWIHLFQGFACAVLFVCSLVLWYGGWPRVDDDQPRGNYLLRLMASGMLCSALTYIPYFVFNSLISPIAPVWRNTADTLCVVVMAFISLFAIALRQQRPSWVHWTFFVALPTVITLGLAIADVPFSVWAVWEVLIYVAMLALYGIEIVRLVRWNKRLKDEFSDIQDKQVQWFWRLTLPLMVFSMMWIPMQIYPNLSWLKILYPLIEIVLFFCFTSFAIRQGVFTIPQSTSAESEEAQQPAEEGLHPEWEKRLLHAIHDECIYRRTGLNMTDLARAVGVNRTYLSRYFHQTEQGSFYEYINYYRLCEAERLLRTSSLGIVEIAEQCGFSNRTAFVKIFKDAYKTTPSLYRKEVTDESGSDSRCRG